MAFAAAGQAGFSSGAALGGSPFAGILDGLTKGQKLALLGEQTKTLAMRSEMMEKFLSGGFGKKKTGEPSGGSPYSPGKAGGEALGASGATAVDAFIGPPSKGSVEELEDRLSNTDDVVERAKIRAEINATNEAEQAADRQETNAYNLIGDPAIMEVHNLTQDEVAEIPEDAKRTLYDAIGEDIKKSWLDKAAERRLGASRAVPSQAGMFRRFGDYFGWNDTLNDYDARRLREEVGHLPVDQSPEFDAYFSNPLDDMSSAVRRARAPLLQQALPTPPGTLPPGILKSFPYLQQLMGDDQPLTTLGGIQQLSALNAGSTRKY